ncbi:unnamed protein product [Phytomonas sp. Hart1]|nr:unnamed protein product [Phytomonas sp. Hart1]|eukprot:CCW69998.1 unnamed protein product [Phytomonas sp. isolate Hart1]
MASMERICLRHRWMSCSRTDQSRFAGAKDAASSVELTCPSVLPLCARTNFGEGFGKARSSVRCGEDWAPSRGGSAMGK